MQTRLLFAVLVVWMACASFTLAQSGYRRQNSLESVSSWWKQQLRSISGTGNAGPTSPRTRRLLSESSEASDWRGVVSSFDRKTLGGRGISSRLCAYSNGSCDNGAYGSFLGRSAIGPAVMAILFVLLFLVFWGGRYCCYCCGNGTFGGVKASSGIFITDPETFNGYSKMHRMVVLVLLIVACVIATAFTIVSFVAIVRLHDGANGACDGITGLGAQILTNITIFNQTISKFPYITTTQYVGSINSAYQQGQDVLNRINNYCGDVHDAVNAVAGVTYTALIVLLILYVGTVVIAIIGFGCPLYIPACVSIPIGVLLWVIFTAFLLSGIVFADSCNEFDIWRASHTGVFDMLARCNDSGAAFNALQSTANSAEQSAFSGMCKDYSTLRSNFGCACNALCPNDTAGILSSQLLDGGTQTTVQQCAVSCSNSQTRQLAFNINLTISLSQQFDTLFNNMIVPLLNCRYSDILLGALLNPVCTEALSGNMLGFVGYMFLAASMLFLFVTATLAVKRMNKDNAENSRSLPVRGSDGYH